MSDWQSVVLLCRAHLSVDHVVRVEVSVDDVDGRGEHGKSNDWQQELQRVESDTDWNVIVPVCEVHQRASSKQRSHAIKLRQSQHVASSIKRPWTFHAVLKRDFSSCLTL